MTKKIKTLNKVAIGVATAIAMSYGPTVSAGETQWSGYVENATYFRDKKGLSKFRNTAQAEFYKPVESDGWSNVSINGVLRATYDGVYDLNDGEFGKNAGENYLGENWHDNNTASSSAVLNPGVAFPCENDPALCNNLDGYMDQDENDAKFSDFNDELDFIRELYITADKQLANGDIFNVTFGKQQVVWGKTDLFRVLDVVNPVDYSRHNIYDELEDIRIPQWMLTAEWRMGANTILMIRTYSLSGTLISSVLIT